MARGVGLQAAVIGLGLVLIGACHREVPTLPEFPDVGPFLQQTECVACLQDMCAGNFDECMADEVGCKREYECRGTCSDPTCHMDCSAAAGVAVGGTPFDTPLWTLAFCAATSCADECATGKDFSCVGAYDPKPGPEEVTLPVEVSDIGRAPIPGMNVFVCPGFIGCPIPKSSHSVADGGPASVTLNARLDFLMYRQDPRCEPAGSDLCFPTAFERQTLPWGQRPVLKYLATVGETRIASVQGGATLESFDPQRPMVHIVALDCANMRAVGVRAETDLTDAECLPFERCDSYWRGNEAHNDVNDTSAEGPASVTIVAPAARTFDARLIDPATKGRAVHRIRPNLVASTQEAWWAYPLTREQEQELLQ